jgi:hypothetical protein
VGTLRARVKISLARQSYDFQQRGPLQLPTYGCGH